MKKNTLTVWLLITGFISPYISLSQEKLIIDGLDEIAMEHKAIGLAVAVVKDNEIVFSHALGYKDKEAQEALSTDDLFRIASISKSFSSTAIMQLVDEGRISLEDDFGDLIGFPVRNPKFPDTKITLKMVLSHTSSINDRNGYFNLDVINPHKNESWKGAYNDYEPGTDYEYCNLNFNMIGAVIEKITNERFDVAIKKRVLDPLNLSAGYCIDSLDQSRFVNLYAYNEKLDSFNVQPAAYDARRDELKQYVLGHSAPVFSPTGGLKISSSDLARYMMMHMNYGEIDGVRILSEPSSLLMQTKITDKEGYGLALMETEELIQGVHLVGHTGSAYGLYSTMFFSPEDKYGFIVITNGCDGESDGPFVTLSKKVINHLYQKLIK